MILKCTSIQHYQKQKKSDTEQKMKYLIRYATEKIAGYVTRLVKLEQAQE